MKASNEVTAISNDSSISVITATYNTVAELPDLIESLSSQTDMDFEWVVADGGSTDGTPELLREVSNIRAIISSQPDFGIYDAINRAIKQSSGQYYLVIGADDYLYPDAIGNFKKYISKGTDIIAANIQVGERVRRPGRGKAWLFGQYEFVAGHAVGTLFKKSLHERFGYYSRHFPIAADQLFIKQCGQSEIAIIAADFTAGRFGLSGISAQDSIGTLSEFFRVQLRTEKYKSVQLAIYLVRLLKNYSKL
ncbi:MAG: glycosyltransferase [Oceanicoccus sp.]